MDQHDRHFESFLRGFEPRRPRALPTPHGQARRLAAAFAVAAAFGCSLWFLFRGSSPDHTASLVPKETAAMAERGPERLPPLVPLTRIGLQDPVRLDATLTEASRRTLPDLRSKDSMLRLLAKE